MASIAIAHFFAAVLLGFFFRVRSLVGLVLVVVLESAYIAAYGEASALVLLVVLLVLTQFGYLVGVAMRAARAWMAARRRSVEEKSPADIADI